jgi:hypothetical protein
MLADERNLVETWVAGHRVHARTHDATAESLS